MKKIMDFLRNEGISPELIQEVQEFSAVHPVKEELNGRIPVPHLDRKSTRLNSSH